MKVITETVLLLLTNGDPDVKRGPAQRRSGRPQQEQDSRTNLGPRPRGAVSSAEGRTGKSTSVKEQATIRLLYILSKRGVKHNATMVLLAWCKANGFPTTTATSFDPKARQWAGDAIWVAIGKGDWQAVEVGPTWHILYQSFVTLHAK